MKKFFSVFCLFIATSMLMPSLAYSEQSSPIFSPLKVGQHINIVPANGGFEVALLDDGTLPSGYVVVELGATYLVVEDIVRVNRTWIPVTAIMKVTHTRLENLRR